jgi:hypothetical protein
MSQALIFIIRVFFYHDPCYRELLRFFFHLREFIGSDFCYQETLIELWIYLMNIILQASIYIVKDCLPNYGVILY